MNQTKARFDSSKASLTEERMGRVSPRVRGWMQSGLGAVLRGVHQTQLLGVENLPEGPFILVANHSGGLGISELFALGAEWAMLEGEERPVAGFAHAFMFGIPAVRQIIEAFGGIPSTYESAARALEAGVPILVFPGGDYDTLRPVWKAEDVDFNGRKGFLKIARANGVPVVPLGIRGGSYTAPMLVRSELLAKVFPTYTAAGFKRAGISLLGVLVSAGILSSNMSKKAKLAATYAWLSSPFVYLPWIPARMTFRIGEPLQPEDLFDGSEEELSSALGRVERAVEDLVRTPHPS